MYDPTEKEVILIKVLKELGYWVWWDGYKVVSNATTETKKIIHSLIYREEDL